MSKKLTLQPALFAEATSAAHLPFYVQNLNKRNGRAQNTRPFTFVVSLKLTTYAWVRFSCCDNDDDDGDDNSDDENYKEGYMFQIICQAKLLNWARWGYKPFGMIPSSLFETNAHHKHSYKQLRIFKSLRGHTGQYLKFWNVSSKPERLEPVHGNKEFVC